jgi:hypothetical protein
VLTYGGGEAQKSTQLELLCAPGVSGLDTGPTFMGKKGGVFRFSWKTSAGCPLNATRAGGAAARAATGSSGVLSGVRDGVLSAQLLRAGYFIMVAEDGMSCAWWSSSCLLRGARRRPPPPAGRPLPM